MQKSFAAIALVLTLTCALALYTPYNHAIAPVPVADDSDFNFTNTSTLSLASITPGDIYLVSGNFSYNFNNPSASHWNLWYRKLNSKTLATGANETAAFSAPPLNYTCYNNYVIGFGYDNQTGIPQIRAYQVSLTGGAAPSRITLSKNTNASFIPGIIEFSMIKKTAYIFYYAAHLTVNVTNFVIGSSTVGTPEFTLSTAFDNPIYLSVAWGEALGSNQIFAVWAEKGVVKDSVLDVSKGKVGNPKIVAGFNSPTEACGAYATDKKFYGLFCIAFDLTTMNIAYYVSTNTSSLVQYANYNAFASIPFDIVPYGPYLAVMFQDLTAVTGDNYAYEIWDLDAFKNFKNRTLFLNIDSRSTFIPFKTPSGGYYTLLYNNRRKYNGALTSVKVGLLLDGYASNKTSVLLLIALLIPAFVVVAAGVYYYRKKRSSKMRSDEKVVSMVEEKLMPIADVEEARAIRGL